MFGDCSAAITEGDAPLAYASAGLTELHGAIDLWSGEVRTDLDSAGDSSINLAYARVRAGDLVLAKARRADDEVYTLLGAACEIVQAAADGEITGEQVAGAQAAVDRYLEQVDRVAAPASFDGSPLTGGDISEWVVDMPPSSEARGVFGCTFPLPDLSPGMLDLGGVSVSSAGDAEASLSTVDGAMD